MRFEGASIGPLQIGLERKLFEGANIGPLERKLHDELNRRIFG